MEKNPLLERVYNLDGDKTKIRDTYGEWASQYDHDTVEGMGYVAPMLSAARLAEAVDDHANVLDAGCGTGLVGAALSTKGVVHIDGIDLSPAMLEMAGDKKVYEKLDIADLTRKLDIKSNTYDGVVSTGVFTSGHVGPKALDELARVAKPGAPIVVTVHEKVWEKDAYPEHLARMEERGLVEIEEIATAPYHEKEGYECKLCFLRAA